MAKPESQNSAGETELGSDLLTVVVVRASIVLSNSMGDTKPQQT
jgi:hypothetical protein